MAAKIGYSVIYASSSESGHDATELEVRNNLDINSDRDKAPKSHNTRSSKGNGWQSARFCDYPQELVIALNSIYEISQIQILSHQSKIASKIEIWVGLDAENTLKHTQSTYKSLHWKRLGYLSLDKNERSNWKARELKSVYINTMANYIKFSLQESHINSINLFNQVGIVALGVLGKLSQHHQYNEDALHVAMTGKMKKKKKNKTQNSGSNEHDTLSDDSEIDELTAKKIRELTILKKQAVQQEDYDEAKRCKVCIENLKNSAKKLFHLEQQKHVAVQQEDYDTAKQLKLQIEQLRTMSLSTGSNDNNAYHGNPTMSQYQQSQPFQPTHMMQPPPPQQQQQQQAFNPQAVLQPSAIGNIPAAQPVAAPYVPYPPQQQQQPPAYQQPSSGRAPMMPAMDPSQHAQSRSHSNSHSMSMSPQHYQQQQQPQMARAPSVNNPDERAIRPMQRNFNTMDVSNIANPFGAASSNENNNNSNNNNNNKMAAPPKPKAQPEPMRAVHSNAPSMSNNNNKIGNEDGGPPPLKAAVKNGSEKLIEIFGEYTICLINSPNWNHRDEGLKAVVSFVQKKEHPDQRQVFKLTAKLIYQLLQDRVASVQLTAIDSLNSVMGLYGDKREVDGSEMAKALHSIVTTLVNLLGHNNTRLVDSAGSTLISLCHLDEFLCKTVYNVLIKKMKKALPKHLKGRGLILLQLVPQFGVPRGCEMNHLMDNLVLTQLMHKNGDLRDIGIQITTLLFQMEQYRNHIVHYLEHANLNDFIKDSLNNSFQQATGHTNVLERDPKSIKEQSRPSKTMNRTGSGSGNNTRNATRNSNNRRSTRGGRGRTTRGRGRGRGARGRARGGGHGNNNNRNNQQQQQAARKQHEEEEEGQEDECNFCGLRDRSFVENEENLDLHYWQSCPMLTSCKLCEQVIEIATLHEHILTECESGIKHQLCKKCNIPFPVQQINQHTAQCNENSNGVKCPLCLTNINADSPQSWKQHLLNYPGCKSNPRPLLQ